ncbi:uncharacterized protein K489DRAFT_366292 [Dissoconium aciculare CBS 342.82]|jgi:hypothetical protein|uniref:F-box domain-containing protein n=1 Tax=Dissoconium aciculare CBS 342.82 TaxID=1314786 RepID=A0A6J3MGL7_9PEZI|nr:uncharacterized protein K489DRAFT_366292 [Dissoconium aciculare CBS 342.82]KAF1827095.1 hypothetical protein K489DRAFT_366292 [Dissoconium aciculare CBS 342.82]
MSLAEQVFGVPELAELILLCASTADIVRLQQVNKTIYNTIRTSRALRRKLYLEPDSSCEQTANPLAPDFFQRLPGMRKGTITVRVDVEKLWASTLNGVAQSWQDMFVSQPPATISLIATGDASTSYCRRIYPDGMKYGDVATAIIAAHQLRKGSQSRPERLSHLTKHNNPVLIYWR